MLEQHHELDAYRSIYWDDDRDGGVGKQHVISSAATGLVH